MQGQKSVPELDRHLARTVRVTILFMLGMALGLIFDPGDPVIWGLLLGGCVGIFNAYALTRRVKKVDLMDQRNARRFMTWGMAARMALVGSVVLLAGKLTTVSIFGIGAGLLLPSAISISLSVVDSIREARRSNALE